METLKRFWTFLKESWVEVRHKTTWPSWKEVKGTWAVVIVTTIVFAVFLGLADLAMFRLMNAVFDLFARA